MSVNSNPYNPTDKLIPNAEYDLRLAKDDIYQSADKKRYVP